MDLSSAVRLTTAALAVASVVLPEAAFAGGSSGWGQAVDAVAIEGASAAASAVPLGLILFGIYIALSASQLYGSALSLIGGLAIAANSTTWGGTLIAGGGGGGGSVLNVMLPV